MPCLGGNIKMDLSVKTSEAMQEEIKALKVRMDKQEDELWKLTKLIVIDIDMMLCKLRHEVSQLKVTLG